ncbi:PREDICTED: uncharacterized protein LOC105116247 isoform X1 [Populus euphratica]|uniref:Uncharacterized protein LOC105116247 isoform X1 n=1 Tax=Populus euphratica TaxID=75702 RepID=A0AAJ6TIG8_POPEU|nr:PREDICTED: uncharacterized protein LOC105116247 isoform X1 [Populus euphratica]XP_011011796.1 PREDICTED: uncharacterized protein LOC105116247 isoform X1 [Populus euphratica]
MEEIRRAAGAYYKHLPENNKEQARETFNAMDKNRDGKISVREYMDYLNEKKATDFTHQSIFSALDKDGNGSLDFNEAIVLYYIMQSGRAIICQSCKTFLAGAYFSCSECFFNDSVSTYEICCECYGDNKFTHHDGAIFCDNYTLLCQSRSATQAAPMKKRTNVLNILKRGLQVAGITSSDLGGIITGDDVDGSSRSSCSIM